MGGQVQTKARVLKGKRTREPHITTIQVLHNYSGGGIHHDAIHDASRAASQWDNARQADFQFSFRLSPSPRMADLDDYAFEEEGTSATGNGDAGWGDDTETQQGQDGSPFLSSPFSWCCCALFAGVNHSSHSWFRSVLNHPDDDGWGGESEAPSAVQQSGNKNNSSGSSSKPASLTSSASSSSASVSVASSASSQLDIPIPAVPIPVPVGIPDFIVLSCQDELPRVMHRLVNECASTLGLSAPVASMLLRYCSYVRGGTEWARVSERSLCVSVRVGDRIWTERF